jgi:hypothetical protein
VRGDSYSIGTLPERLVEDWYRLSIFTEYDMQVAVYYWLRREFERSRSSIWTVRTQPTLDIGGGRKVKPDVVLFRKSVPYDVFELKCHLNAVQPTLWDIDSEKLRELKDTWNIRHAYQLVLYDDVDNWSLPRQKQPWMKQYFSFVGANVRLHSSGRLRRGYDEARRSWERRR